MDVWIVVEAKDDGLDPLGITGLTLPSTLTAPSRLWGKRVLFFQLCITTTSFNHGLPTIIDNNELCDDRFITTKETRNLTLTILASTFLTIPRGFTLP